MSASNGVTEWGRMFADLQDKHAKDGKRPSYTAVFNDHLDALIAESEVPLEWRFLAWVWRKSWGHNSDCAVDRIGGKALGQNDAAEAFGVRKQRISECVSILHLLNFLLCDQGHKLYPVVDPTQQKRRESEKMSGRVRTFDLFLEEWKVRSAADFQALESARGEVEKLRKVQFAAYQEWRRGRTSSGASLYTTNQQPTLVSSSSNVGLPPEFQQQPAAAAVLDEESEPEPEPSEQRAPPETPSVEEVAAVHAELRQLGPVAPETSAKLIRECRAVRLDCPVEEITHAVRSFRGKTGKKNLVGLALTQAPKLIAAFAPPSAQPPPHTGLDPGRREMLEAIANDERNSDEERQNARDLLNGG